MAQPEIREEHRRLLEKWLYEGLTDQEAERLPPELLERARSWLRDMIEEAKGAPAIPGDVAMRQLADNIERRRKAGPCILVRQARPSEFEAILDLDEVTARDPQRASDIRGWVDGGSTIVAEEHERLLGYAVLDHSFFGRAFLRMVNVASSSRRRGVGRALVRAAEARASTPRIFTSTNASNTAMQSLLTSLGYTRCGEVHGLDEGDPEVFYFRDLNTSR